MDWKRFSTRTNSARRDVAYAEHHGVDSPGAVARRRHIWVTWPHEYVVANRDEQQELLAAFCERISQGEGVECQFFDQKRQYLFLGDYKYWTMTKCADILLDAEDVVLNRALLYRDRRGFVIRTGDTGKREG